jgi:ABC-type transport system involved in Fe-S cluster assembly fused permease/ATPase subunit
MKQLFLSLAIAAGVFAATVAAGASAQMTRWYISGDVGQNNNKTSSSDIGYGRPGASDADIEDAARRAHVLDFILRMPDGWDTMVGERGLKLSGGEKQRVAIARTLLKNPAIMIFDEATSALDSATEKAIQAELREIAKDRTTLVIAHRLSTIIDADQILVLDAGRIIERGTFRELLDANGKFAEMWRLQQQEAEKAAVQAV